MTTDFYYAADQNGQHNMFLSLPKRNYRDGLGCWSGDYSVNAAFFFGLLQDQGLRLPRIGWEDEPVRIRIKIKIK